MNDKPLLVACPGANDIAKKVAKRLGVHLLPVKHVRFLNGETKIEVLESCRDRSAFIFQDVANKYPIEHDGSKPVICSVNDHLISIVAAIDALKWCDVRRITLVLPTFPYSRQHAARGREPLMASAVCDIFKRMGVNSIITLDIHSESIIGYARPIKTENVRCLAYLLREMKKQEGSFNDFVVVAPDTGAIGKSKFAANVLGLPLSFMYKERDYSKVTNDSVTSNVKGVTLIGEVKDKNVILLDDMIDSGGTLLNVCKELKNQGAKKIIVLVTLPFFNGDAPDAFQRAYEDGFLHKVISTNAVKQDGVLNREWFKAVDITPLLAQVIERVHEGKSISMMLDSTMEILQL